MEASYKKEVSGISKLGISLIFLYTLNLTDLFFTKYLLWKASDLFYEANMFLNPIINGLEAYFLKVVVFAVALLYWGFRSRKSTDKQLRTSFLVSRIFLFVYMGINLVHLFNLMLLYSL